MNGVYMITAFFPAFSVSVGLSLRITPLCRCPLCLVKLSPLRPLSRVSLLMEKGFRLETLIAVRLFANLG